jgi:hypothetical protein
MFFKVSRILGVFVKKYTSKDNWDVTEDPRNLVACECCQFCMTLTSIFFMLFD